MGTMRPGGWDAYYDALERAFGGVPEPEEYRTLWNRLTEPERTLAVYDQDEVVGTAGAFSFRVSVPGGAVLPAAGVTMVSVQSTHRRRGLLSAMMRRQLTDVRAMGEPFAVLTASEPPIYGRFGYGAATERMLLQVDTSRVSLRVPEGTDQVRLRLADPAKALDACEEVYAQQVPGRPGMLERQPGWAELGVVDPEKDREGHGELLCVTAECDGKLTGYARYAIKPDWSSTTGAASGTVTLRDLEALDPVSYAALWRYLFEVDLTSTVVALNRPVDDPLLHMVSDIRRCGVRVRDELYLRLVDLGAALAGRSYAVPVDVVLEVRDPFCPWNEGRWRLSGDADGARCERTTDPADLSLSVRELGTVYLGGSSLRALAAAGRVEELRSGALAPAARAFSNDPAPWSPHGF